ncbi:ferritin-like domain-containing protein [Tellurirhabdus rosea]|uniref:ferritin-like domain-containing protein n=1 Tax=Tellurirhabdus rosea TaxID=2674997 RepID=UPI00224CA64E|nr:ferritin-like domain-containing protein [Tellurirhabdus rosea]
MSKFFSNSAGDARKTELRLEPVGRRLFLRMAGAAAATTSLMVAGCSKDPITGDDMTARGGARIAAGVDLGSGDVGILNYAYALEQLEAAFYDMVVKMPYNGINADERQILKDIRDHEITHREFFKRALGSAAIGDLEVDFSAVNFKDRNSVLTTARAFEDLGVSAYNGAGKYLMTPDYLLLAGKIVSVEARHASVIRSLLAPKTGHYAGVDVVNGEGLEKSREPKDVLAIASPFVKTMITGPNLPNM